MEGKVVLQHKKSLHPQHRPAPISSSHACNVNKCSERRNAARHTRLHAASGEGQKVRALSLRTSHLCTVSHSSSRRARQNISYECAAQWDKAGPLAKGSTNTPRDNTSSAVSPTPEGCTSGRGRRR